MKRPRILSLKSEILKQTTTQCYQAISSGLLNGNSILPGTMYFTKANDITTGTSPMERHNQTVHALSTQYVRIFKAPNNTRHLLIRMILVAVDNGHILGPPNTLWEQFFIDPNTGLAMDFVPGTANTQRMMWHLNKKKNKVLFDKVYHMGFFNLFEGVKIIKTPTIKLNRNVSFDYNTSPPTDGQHPAYYWITLIENDADDVTVATLSMHHSKFWYKDT